MADSVPDNETFSLQDVIDVVGGSSLQDCFDNAVLAGFDSNYDDYVKGSGVRNSLYNFRNYHIPSTIYDGIVYAYLGPKANPYSCHTHGWQWGSDFEAVRNMSVGDLGAVDKEYLQVNVESITGALESMHIYRSHVRFDFTTIPVGASIVSAILEFAIYQSFGTEYSYANNYGTIYLMPTLAWTSVGGILYGTIRKYVTSGNWYPPIFRGTTSLNAYGTKLVAAIPADFPYLESRFGGYMYGTFVTRQDKEIIPPGYGQKVGVYISAPASDALDHYRRLSQIIIRIQYTI